MNDTTIDDLLNELTGNPDTAPVDQVAQAKSALYDFILKEVIGVGGKFREPEDELDRGIQIGYDTLRAELEEKLKELIK